MVLLPPSVYREVHTILLAECNGTTCPGAVCYARISVSWCATTASYTPSIHFVGRKGIKFSYFRKKFELGRLNLNLKYIYL